MSNLNEEIAAFENMRNDLEVEHFGKWVVFHNKELVEIFDSFECAAADAVSRFGRGPYLIREIGAPPVTLPTSVSWLIHAN